MNDLESTRLKLKCLEMTENTDLQWWEVITYRGQPCNTHPCLSNDRDEYKIAIGLIEGKPVWPDSKVYSSIGQECFASEVPLCVLLSSYSWTPPKPTTLTIELNADDVKYWMQLYTQSSTAGLFDNRSVYIDTCLRFYAACQKALETRK